MGRLFALALAAVASLAAQGADPGSGWQFYRELSTVPGTGLATLTLDPDILAAARNDAADLRLVDAEGKPVPYELRVLRGERNAESYPASEVSRGTEGDSALIVLDLGENPGEHNQVQVDTQGDNFRRQVSVFGSDDAQQWTPLIETGMVLRITGNGKTASINRIPYSPSEYRYVRITVARDQRPGQEPPLIESAAVQRATIIPGEEQAIAAGPVTRETIGEGELSASRYTIDLPGRLPLHALRFNTSAGPFARNYQLLSLLDAKIAPFAIAGGRLARPAGPSSNVISLRFQEVFARRLQMTIVDGGETPLDVLDPVVLTAARQLVVELGAAQPWRLYYGNPAAPAPDGDLNPESLGTLDKSAPEFDMGPQQLNPAYEAPPAPLSERMPWLIYVLTAMASLALLAILRSLVFDVDS